MEKAVILFLLMLTTLAVVSNAQDTDMHKQPTKATAIEKFNIDLFNKSQQWSTSKYYEPDGTKVVLQIYGKGYYEERMKPGGAYRSVKYYYSNLSLQSSGNRFYNASYGQYCEYDTLGNITKKIDTDAPYRFTIRSLINKVLKTVKIDLRFAKPGMDVDRYIPSDTGKPLYRVTLPINSMSVRVIILDGNTGRILSDRNTGIVD